MSVFFKCCSLERKLHDKSQFEGACLNFCKKYEGPIFLVLSVVFAILTALVAYGHIPPFGGVGSMFNAGLITGIGIMISTVSFYMGLMQTLTSQGCLVVREEPNLD